MAGTSGPADRPATRCWPSRAHRLFYGISTISIILLYRNYFTDHGIWRAGLPGLAEVFAASGVGVLLAAVATPRVTARVSKPAWITALLVFAAVVEASARHPVPSRTCSSWRRCCSASSRRPSRSASTRPSRRRVDEVFLGRVFSVYDTLFNLVFVAAAVLSALALPKTGHSYASIAVITVGYAATAAWFWAATVRDGRDDAPIAATPSRPSRAAIHSFTE